MRVGLAGAVSPLLGWPAGYSLHMAVWGLPRCDVVTAISRFFRGEDRIDARLLDGAVAAAAVGQSAGLRDQGYTRTQAANSASFFMAFPKLYQNRAMSR
jgi:hypothetical protein